jgi:hypothetical protein
LVAMPAEIKQNMLEMKRPQERLNVILEALNSI